MRYRDILRYRNILRNILYCKCRKFMHLATDHPLPCKIISKYRIYCDIAIYSDRDILRYHDILRSRYRNILHNILQMHKVYAFGNRPSITLQKYFLMPDTNHFIWKNFTKIYLQKTNNNMH